MTDHLNPKRTQAERTRLRKEQVIRAATHFFGQHGYHGAKLSEIARAAGVTEPGLLHHYPSKVQLLMDVLAERDRIDHERFNLSETGGLLASLQDLVEHNQTVPGLVQLFTVLAAESIDEQHPGHEFFLQRYRQLRQRFLERIQLSQRQGEIRDDISAEELTVLVFALMDGLQIQWLYEPDQVNMAQVFKQFVRLLKPPQINEGKEPTHATQG